ncbi:PREDICTED: uncharacterized protein LOC107169326 isoform X2 [Diuraphis noxia]|uniref:uncharacterized protein LOC107169326 isoform X2 n=1 Tax=Diuraphis noxia TaxID=143948 RepID=UPI000763B13D|nr:PREDICTED: uncharacterized protein LOC107169326 isoform X2 [Diuraphis noxia]
MKTSNVCVLVISALVVAQVSSEVTELDKMALTLFQSLVDIVEIPYRKIENIVNPSEAGIEKEPFLDDLIIKLKRKKEEIEKKYLESLSPETRELQKKRISEFANTSQRILNSIQTSSKMARSMINAYFNHLPKNVQNKLIGLGQDLNNILHKLKEMSKNDSSAAKNN